MSTAMPSSRESEAQVSYAYQLFILFLCVYAIVSLAAGVLFPLRVEVRTLLDYVDHVVCAIFLIDFLNSFARAKSKTKYFFTWGWIDLLSSIPAVEQLRIGRLARIVRIIRVLRSVRAMRFLLTHLVSRKVSSAFYTVLAVSFSIVVIAALAVLRFELEGGGNIRTAGDALWFALSTITTVGYGDQFPATAEGRIVAVVLMTAGVGLFGALSGIIAGWFVGSATDAPKPEVSELKTAVDELRAAVERLSRENNARRG